MKLPNSRRTGVQSLGKRNAGLPLANANRVAGQIVEQGRANVRLAQERGAMVMQAVGDAQSFTLKLAESESKQGYFEQVMSFESKAKMSMQELTKNNMVDLNSIDIPESARGVMSNYQEKDVDGKMVRMAPAHEVGTQIHEARMKQYMDLSDEQLENDKTRDEFRRAIRVTYSNSTEAVFAKGTVDRVNMLKAHTSLNFDNAIDLLDAEKAGQIAATALATGAWSDIEYAQNMESLGSRIDEKHFVKEIVTAKSSSDLLDIIEELNTTSNNLTGKQQLSLTKEAERRQDKLTQSETVEAETDSAAQKAWALQMVDTDKMNIHTLYSSGLAPDVIPSVRAAIQQRDSEGYQYSDPLVVRGFQNSIGRIQFPGPGQDVAVMAQEAKQRLFESMTGQAIGYRQYKQMVAEVDKGAKAGYNTPEYRLASDSVELEILNMSAQDAKDAQMTAYLKGDKTAVVAWERKGKMQAKAMKDLQGYVRRTGVAAKPAEWWEDHKENYTAEAFTSEADTRFQSKYREHAVYSGVNGDGKFDKEATIGDMVMKNHNGQISDKDFDTMYRELNGDGVLMNAEPIQ